MFAVIREWIRKVWLRLMNQSDVKSALQVDVAISSIMAEKLQLWTDMYENNASWLKKDEVFSLNLPVAIASEISRSVTIEMKIKVEGSTRADFLNSQMEAILPLLRDQVEVGAAKGGLMLKPFIDGDKVVVDFVQADQFYPIEFNSNKEITACIFSDQRTVGDKYYTRLEYHKMTEEGCEITNQAFKSSSKDTLGVQVSLEEIPEWADLEPAVTIEGIEKPLYSYFKYPLANNFDRMSPLGVSCYSRAVDLIEQADKQWSDFLWEFDSGKRALYVDILAFGKDDKGKPILPNKRLYKTLNMSGDINDENMFNEWSPEFRDINLLNGLDAILRKIEFLCGIAYGTLSNPQSVDKTATEIKISNQRTYSTITDTQKALQQAIEGLLFGMDVWATLGSLAPMGSYESTFHFDDSVVTDTDTQLQQDLRMVGASLISRVEFRMRNFGEDEKTAKEALAKIQQDQPMDLFGPRTPNRTPTQE